MLIDRISGFDNKRLFDEGDNFSTDEVCSMCEKPTSAYIEVPIVWEKDDKLLICKSCLYKCDMMINKCILG